MGTETISLDTRCEYDIVYAYCQGRVGYCMPDIDENGYYPTWGEVLDCMGFYPQQGSFFFVHAENPTRGVILNYGNYTEDRENKVLRVVGETIGYA